MCHTAQRICRRCQDHRLWQQSTRPWQGKNTRMNSRNWDFPRLVENLSCFLRPNKTIHQAKDAFVLSVTAEEMAWSNGAGVLVYCWPPGLEQASFLATQAFLRFVSCGCPPSLSRSHSPAVSQQAHHLQLAKKSIPRHVPTTFDCGSELQHPSWTCQIQTKTSKTFNYLCLHPYFSDWHTIRENLFPLLQAPLPTSCSASWVWE